MHSPFPYGLCDPRQSLHLSWGNQPSRQLFPPLQPLPQPSTLLPPGGGAALPSLPPLAALGALGELQLAQRALPPSPWSWLALGPRSQHLIPL